MQTGVAGGVGGGTQIIKLIGERKYFDSFQNDTNKPANWGLLLVWETSCLGQFDYSSDKKNIMNSTMKHYSSGMIGI